MGLLDQIRSPRDLRDLDDQQLVDLAGEIRAFLVAQVSKTGGHLGPNLGVVEVTMAIHRVFDSPRDRVVFDTGHQAYVHKILTGRAEQFETLRQQGGLSGYPSQAESAHDVVENSHASTSLSYADGLAKAYVVKGEDRHVVAVVGDGALTGGMTWEALNNIAAAKDSKLVIVVNDNGRSYSATVGGLAEHLAGLRTHPQYEPVLDQVRLRLIRTKLVGPPLYDVLHAIKKGLKDALAPQGLFEDLGLKYLGPVDGHDIAAMEQALAQAKNFGGPVIVHTLTKKGLGYSPAELHDEDNFHSLGAFDPETGEQLASAADIWTDVFREELVEIGGRRADIVAVTAAMLYPTGLYGFAAAYPERCFDLGIAEQHAVTSATGMALAGLHPVVA
nr:1-deoxy-D-xylulose-5-phosphate synthase [Propionibacteriales bacterium]